ncbi:hypothetical protein OG774_20415 [Actinomycetospora sp. NBC_00405]
MIGAVALPHLSHAVLEAEVRAARAGGHVAVPEQVAEQCLLVVELGELVGNAELLGLRPCRRVKGDEVDGALRSAVVAEIARSVERMEAGDREVRRVPDVVHPSRRLEELTVLTEFARCEPRLPSNGNHMGPAPGS